MTEVQACAHATAYFVTVVESLVGQWVFFSLPSLARINAVCLSVRKHLQMMDAAWRFA